MTIEERAKQHWPQPFIDYGIRFYNRQQMREAYMMGAREQCEIDIQNAIEWFDILLDGRPFLDDGWKDDLRKTMEE